MALTERLQILVESLGGAAVVGDFTKIGRSAQENFGKVSKAGDKAAADVKVAQEQMARTAEAGAARIQVASQKAEAAQLRAAQAAAAADRARAAVATTVPGTTAAALATERLEAAELKSAHAAQVASTAQARLATTTVAVGEANAAAATSLTAVEANAAQVAASSGIAGASLNRMGVAGTGVAGVLSGPVALGAGIAGAAILKMAQESGASFLHVAEQVDNLQDVIGGTAVSSSRLRNIASILGVDVETLGKAFLRLSVNIDKGKLDEYGIAVAKNKDGTAELYETLLRISDAYNATQDPIKRNTLLFDLFGRSGVDLIDILERSRAELEAFAGRGPAIDEEDVESARTFRNELEALKNEAGKLGVEIGGPVVRGVTYFSRGLRGLGDGVGFVKDHIGALVPLAKVLSIRHKDAADATDEHSRAAKGLADELDPLRNSLKLSSDAVEDLDKRLSRGIAEFKGTASSIFDNATKVDKLRDASRSLTTELDRLSAGTIGADLSASAFRVSLEELGRTVANTEAVTKAQERLAETTERAAERRVDAAARVEDAERQAADQVIAASERVATALARENEQRIAGAERVAEAEARANDQLRSAADRVAEAERRRDNQRALNRARSPGQADAIRRAQQAQELEDDVTRAQREQAETAQKVAADVARAREDEAVAARKSAADVVRAREDEAEATRKAADDIAKARRDMAAVEAEVAKNVGAAEKDLRAALDNAGVGFDLNTEQGRTNSKMLETAVDRLKDHMRWLVDHEGTQDQVRAAWDEDVDALRRVMIQMGFTGEEADRLIGKYGLIPPVKETFVALAGVERAIDDADRVVKALVDKFGLAQSAAEKIYTVLGQSAVAALQKIRADAGNILAGTSLTIVPAQGLNASAAQSLPTRAHGGLIPLSRAAAGMMVSSPMVVAGEGNPAYPEYVIATDPQYRQRNQDLWTDAGRKLASFAHGSSAGRGPASIDYRRLGEELARRLGGRQNTFTINPPPGVEPLHIAKAIAWELS